MALNPQEKDEVKKMISEAVRQETSDLNAKIESLQKTIADFGGEEFSNLSVFGKPMQLTRSLRLLPISPTQLTASVNDYDVGDSPVVRLSSDASRDVTGLKNGTHGRLLLIINVGGQNIVLKDESASSVAANRFALHGSADLTLNAEDSVLVWYDVASLRWRDVFN